MNSSLSGKALDQKTVLVTGGANGLGRMIAEGMLDAGAELIISSRRDAGQAAAELSKRGRCIGINADLGSPEGVEALAEAVKERCDGLHVLVNNAGRTWGAPIESFPAQAWSRVLSTNLEAPFALIQKLLVRLESAASPEDPARVINIGSIAGKRVLGLDAYSYAASKAGLHQLTRELAAKLGPRNITVNAVLPGFFPTKMTTHIAADEEASIVRRTPLRRLGRPSDIAALCVFLSSPASSYMTGAEIPLDGGLSDCC